MDADFDRDQKPVEPFGLKLRRGVEWVLAGAMVLLVFVPAALYLLGLIASYTVVLLPPFAFGILAIFVYLIWGRKILRARRIAGIRERRLLDEASQRDLK
jgi:hypothetical protein